MQLSELIKTFKEETDEWPETPNELLDFCEYKYNIGEIDMQDYYKLASKLHNKGKSIHHVH